MARCDIQAFVRALLLVPALALLLAGCKEETGGQGAAAAASESEL